MSKSKIILDPLSNPLPFASAITAKYINDKEPSSIIVEYKKDTPNGAAVQDIELKTAKDIVTYIFSLFPSAHISNVNSIEWSKFYDNNLVGSLNFASISKASAELDSFLCLNTFLGGVEFTDADILCWSALRSNAAWNKCIKDGGKGLGVEVQRWFSFIASMPIVADAISELQNAASTLKEKKKDQASYEIELLGAEKGKVVTRFPPEPSGYLHIGHAKAAMLNQYFADAYEGKLLIRFDDTNPSKEKSEYEQSILEDLDMLGIKGSSLSYSSDYFDNLADYCRDIIRRGKAYADDTIKEEMNEQRYNGLASRNRDLSSEKSLEIFESMLKGEDAALKFCIRAKISVDNPNKAMRDPVIFRCNAAPHHRTGTKYKAYPTYDFACPIIDSIEGVTHALRTNEYHDRNDQYYWMVDALELRKPIIWDYSRMNFVYTLLSKRKLNWFVDRGLVTGWNDPRFPTVRGILRRGLTTPALREYILMQGPSKNVLLLEWDKLWTLNKKYIDPTSPRFTALDKEDLVKVELSEGPNTPYVSSIAKHKKNADLGNKDVSFSSHIFVEQTDATGLTVGEEITLMDWGNAIVESILREDNGTVVSLKMKLHLEGDFKKTSKKFTWLSPDPKALINVALYDYDYLITKKKLDEEDNFEDFITPKSEFVTAAVGDSNLADLKKGDIIQLERKGFFICDEPLENDKPLKLILIPDGKAKSISSKAANNSDTAKN